MTTLARQRTETSSPPRPNRRRPSAIEVRPLRPEDRQQWQAYVCRHPRATVFHQRQWLEAVAHTYRHSPFHLVARQANHVVGVLPLFLVKSLFVGRVLISVPYATYGGILAETPEITAKLAYKAKTLCKELNVNYLELRHRDPNGLNLPEIDRYDTFRKELPRRLEEVPTHLPRKARAAARKGLREMGEDCTTFGGDLLEIVYDLYARTLRRLGSPSYSLQLFHALRREFGNDCLCTVVWDHGKPVAGVVSFIFRDEIVPYFSGSTKRGAARGANNVMYLRLMEWAVERRLRWFDFNRTRRDNPGPHAFKRHHGFRPARLHYQVFSPGVKKLPNLSPSNRTYALAGRLWRKMPLWLTRHAGARITRWIP